MKRYLLALFIILLTGSGCSMFTSNTRVRVEVRPDGTCIAEYTSAKEQLGLEAGICGGTVRVDKASTQDAVMLRMMELIQGLTMRGAAAGS